MIAASEKKSLRRAFAIADASKDANRHVDFRDRLVELGEEALQLHYDFLLNARNAALFDLLGNSFDYYNGPETKAFLIGHLRKERDPSILAHLMQFLGLLPGVIEVSREARRLIDHPNAMVRQSACIVLGWTGRASDIRILGRLELEDSDFKVRKWAATAQYQLLHQFPRVHLRVLRNLRAAIEQEKDHRVLPFIVWTAGKIFKRRFGLEERPGKVGFSGDLKAAVRQATTTLDNSIARESKRKPKAKRKRRRKRKS